MDSGLRSSKIMQVGVLVQPRVPIAIIDLSLNNVGGGEGAVSVG